MSSKNLPFGICASLPLSRQSCFYLQIDYFALRLGFGLG